MKVLITGGAGFIGSNFIRHLVTNRPDWRLTNLDALTYAGNLNNLEGIPESDRYKFVKGDVVDTELLKTIFRESAFDCVVNFAAETHVDRSLYDPAGFIRTNVMGTQALLNQARESGVKKFIQVSTDEVYGSIAPGEYADETYRLKPNSPYAASKASADLICRSYFKTFSLPVIITRTCNNYGPYQFPEKIIPFFITKAFNDDILPLYGDGLNIRHWLHVEDNCRAILAVLESGKAGEIYNIGSDSEYTNLDLTQIILKILGKSENLIKFVEDRPGHDRRYAMSSRKIEKETGWHSRITFSSGIQSTIKWYSDNKTWWQSITSGEYKNFYEQHYRNRK